MNRPGFLEAPLDPGQFSHRMPNLLGDAAYTITSGRLGFHSRHMTSDAVPWLTTAASG